MMVEVQSIALSFGMPDCGGLILTFALRAHRWALTAILPPGGVVREVEDTGEAEASWRVHPLDHEGEGTMSWQR